MLRITKQEIVRSAAKHFRERGYLAVSIQEIADDCQISKGSIYKFFPSKDELFAEVFDECQQDYFARVDELMKRLELQGREQFLQQIMLRFQYFMDHKFILIDFTELPIQQNERFHALRMQVRGRLLMLHRDLLRHTYGPDIGPHLPDLVVLYRAILKECMRWLINGIGALSVRETACFIVEKLDVLAGHMMNSGSVIQLLPPSVFDAYMNTMLSGEALGRGTVIIRLIRDIGHEISSLPAGESHRQQLQELAGLLEAELAKPVFSSAVVNAYLSYLGQERELRGLVAQLKTVVFSPLDHLDSKA